jgi:methyl coenzyme M reductase alpha subunit
LDYFVFGLGEVILYRQWGWYTPWTVLHKEYPSTQLFYGFSTFDKCCGSFGMDSIKQKPAWDNP